MSLEKIVVEGVDKNDYPDFVDAYVSYAEENGVPLTDEQLDELNDKHPEIAQGLAFDTLL